MQNHSINDVELEDDGTAMEAEDIIDTVPKVDTRAKYNELRRRAEEILEERRLKREIDYLDDWRD